MLTTVFYQTANNSCISIDEILMHQVFDIASLCLNLYDVICPFTSRYWWKSMSKDIRDFVRSCPECQRANAVNKPPPATLHPVPVHDIFHRWGVDLIRPLKETKNGNRYIIVATEYLSRWAEVDALRDKSAESVHAFLLRLVYRFKGMPRSSA